MLHRLPLLPRSLTIAAILTAPAAAVLIVLAVGGPLAGWHALLGVFAVYFALLVPVHRHVRHLSLLAQRLSGRTVEPREAEPALFPELDRAVLEAEGGWRRRQAELHETLAGAEAIFASLPDPVLMLSSGQEILRANRAAEELFQEPLQARALSGVLRHPALLAAVDRALSEGAGQGVEMTLPVPVERQLAAHIEPIGRILPDGGAAILVLHDVTALTRADRMRADFVANASHELRTPLSTLIGFLETLLGPAREDAAARERFLPVMLEQAQRMARLVSDLLSLSRIELHEHTPPTARVDLASLLRTVAAGLELSLIHI